MFKFSLEPSKKGGAAGTSSLVSTSGPISFNIGGAAAKSAAPKSSSKSSASSSKTRVKTERPAPAPTPEPAVTKRIRTPLDYKKLAAPADIVAPPSASKAAAPSGSSSGSKKSSKKKSVSASSSNNALDYSPSVLAVAQDIVPFMPPVKLAPQPKHTFEHGPPFVTADFEVSELRPVRPTLELKADTLTPEERETAMKELEAIEARMIELNNREKKFEVDQDVLDQEFRLLKNKLRTSLNTLKRAPASRQSSLSGDSRKRSSTRDHDWMGEDDYDEEEYEATHKSRPSGSASGSSAKAPPQIKRIPKDQLQRLPEFARKCARIVDDLITNGKHSFYFKEPVTDLIAPGYSTYVAQPICLLDIRDKCVNQTYTTVEELTSDFDLMYNNAVTYNGMDSPISVEADLLKKDWLKRSKRAFESDGGRRRAKPKAPLVRPVIWAEKEQLVGYIGELDSEQLAHVVQIVAESHNLEGGDQEGNEVELDITEMSDETLRKLQEYVFTYRRSQGLPIEDVTPAVNEPVLEEEDDVQLMDEYEEEPVSTVTKASKSKKSSSGGGSSKRRKEETTTYERKPMAAGPKTHEELKALAEETKRNTQGALQELRDELKRMAGKVVDSDHVQVEGLTTAASEYMLDTASLAQQRAAEEDDDSISSETVSSDDEGGGGPHIIPVAEGQSGDIVIENAAGWLAQEEGGRSSFGGSGGLNQAQMAAGKEDPLWEQFAHQDKANAELSKARQEHEDDLRKERAAKEEELRRAEREKRQREEEEERRRAEEAAEQERENQRRREEERLQRKRERENDDDQGQIDLTEQQRLMAEFEHSKK